jgi:zinc transport system substrate-binding protein
MTKGKSNGILRKLGMVFIVAALATTLGGGCAPDKPSNNGRLGVVVSILPQVDFVEQVGGNRIEVTVMVPPGMSPHTYEPTTSQLEELSQATMYAKVGSGVEFELVWMDRIIEVNRDMLVVDCAAGVTLQEMVTADHDHADEHEHGANDPHIWMSPVNAAIMVENICDGLTELDPDNQDYYEQNCTAYLERLSKIDQTARESMAGVINRAFMTYHPAFGYLARNYDLTMLAIEEEGKEATPTGLAHLIGQAEEHDIKVIFASPQFNPESAEVIAEAIDGEVVFIDPLAQDYADNLEGLLTELAAALE